MVQQILLTWIILCWHVSTEIHPGFCTRNVYTARMSLFDRYPLSLSWHYRRV